MYRSREDTHKKSGFLSVRTTKGVGRVTPLTTKQKSGYLAQSLRKIKNCQNPFQAIIRLKKEKKKWHGPLSH